MKNIFLDANILIDYIEGRTFLENDLEMLLEKEGLYNFYISALSIHICAYVLKLKRDSVKFRIFETSLEILNIIPLTENIINKAIESDFSDFEDLLQYFSAVESCDTIFTRDKRDFDKIQKLAPADIIVIDKYTYSVS